MQSSNQEKPLSQRFTDTILKADMYAQYVHLSIQGKKKVYSLVGLISTFIVFTVIFAFGLFKGLILMQRTEFETQMASVLRPINYSNPEMFQMNEYGFDFAVRTYLPLLPEIGSIEIIHSSSRQVYNETLGYNFYQVDSRVLNMTLCEGDLFNHTDKEEIEFKDIKAYQCLTNKSDLRIGGSFLADHYEYLTVLLKPCENGTSNLTCATPEEIDLHMGRQYVQFRIINYYFDKDQKYDPVQSYIHDQMYFGVLPWQQGLYDIKVKLSKALYDESLSPLSSHTEVQFPQIEDLHQTAIPRSHPDPYMSIALKLDYFSNIYQKNLFSLTDYVSALGGLFNVLYGGGKLAMILFMDSYILQILIRSLFQYGDHHEDEQTRLFKKQYNLQQGADEGEKSQAAKIISEAVHRKPLNVPTQAYSWLCVRLCCGKNRSATAEKTRLFQIGRHRVRNELDVVALFRMMQEFSLVKKLLFSRRQLSMLKWQKSMTLYVPPSQKLSQSPFALALAQRESLPNPLAQFKELDCLNQAVHYVIEDDQRSRVDELLLQGILHADPERAVEERRHPPGRSQRVTLGMTRRKLGGISSQKLLEGAADESNRMCLENSQSLLEAKVVNVKGLKKKRVKGTGKKRANA